MWYIILSPHFILYIIFLLIVSNENVNRISYAYVHDVLKRTTWKPSWVKSLTMHFTPLLILNLGLYITQREGLFWQNKSATAHGLFIGILSLLDILSTSSEFIGFDMKSLFWSFENVVWARVKMTFPVSIFLFFLTRRKEQGMWKHLIPKFQWKSWCLKLFMSNFYKACWFVMSLN